MTTRLTAQEARTHARKHRKQLKIIISNINEAIAKIYCNKKEFYNINCNIQAIYKEKALLITIYIYRQCNTRNLQYRFIAMNKNILLVQSIATQP